MRDGSSWTLRSRLLAVTVALLAAVSLIIGVASVAALNTFLLDRLDRQVGAAFERARLVGAGFGDGDRGGPPAARCSVRTEGRGRCACGGRVRERSARRWSMARSSGPRSCAPTGALRAIEPELAAPLSEVPVDGRPRSLDLGAELGDYRVIAARTPRGDTFVIGLPLRAGASHGLPARRS